MTGEHVTASLTTVSALRMLCLRLPHVATPIEAERLKRFRTLARAPARATEDDVEALATGWADWWRQGRVDDLSEMTRQVDASLISGDRRLASFAIAALSSRGR